MSGRMISIRLHDSSESVKGRVFLYDDQTKTLILKLWDDETQSQTGMGLYNAGNIQLEKIHVLEDEMPDPISEDATP